MKNSIWYEAEIGEKEVEKKFDTGSSTREMVHQVNRKWTSIGKGSVSVG